MSNNKDPRAQMNTRQLDDKQTSVLNTDEMEKVGATKAQMQKTASRNSFRTPKDDPRQTKAE